MSNPKQSTYWYVSAIEVTTQNGKDILGNRKDIFTTEEDGNLTFKKLHPRMLECLGEISPNTEKLRFEFRKDIIFNGMGGYIDSRYLWCDYNPSDGYIGDFEGDLKQVLNGETSPINRVCQRLNEKVQWGAFREDDNGDTVFSYSFSQEYEEDFDNFIPLNSSDFSFWIVHSRGEKKIFSWDNEFLYTECGFQFKRSEIHYFRVMENN